MRRRIAVLMGGVSAEREVSLKSGKGIAEALRQKGHEVH
jgi:D-alanine-D-alanine ligase